MIRKRSSEKRKKWFLSYKTFNTMKNNFYIGIARGIGTAFGFSVLGAIVLLILQYIPIEKIPFIGELFDTFTQIVKSRLG